MSRYVKCKVCGEQFDRDKISCMLVSARRYAHIECAKSTGLEGEIIEPPQRDPDLIALETYIIKLFDIPFISGRIRKQINEYHDHYNYSYSGMLKTLQYWFDIKHESIDKANEGIGIIPYVFSEAKNYYYTLFLAQEANKNKDIKQFKPKEKTITIPPPKVQSRRKMKLFFDNDRRDNE